MKTLLASALLTGALFLGALPCGTAHAQAIDRIAAVVNEDVILQSELDRATRNILNQYANRQDQLPPRDVLERQVLERLVMVRLQVARATESGIRVSDEEVDAAINSVAQQNGMTLDQLRQQLANDGTSFNDFRNSLRDELIIQRLRQSFAQSRVSVSDAEVDAALASQQAAGGVQYHLAHILVALPENATPEQIAIGQQKIDGIKALIDKGEMDFAAAAVRYSDSQNALEGGDLGWRSLSEIPTSFAAIISSMQPGQVIGPTRGPSGFQLLKLIETRDASQAAPAMVTQYQARHILVRPEEGQDDAAAKAQIETLRARIEGGADFAELAREESDDKATAARGGDLGWFTQDQYGAEFGAQVAALQDGQVSQPFKTQAGWHIVQRVGQRQINVTDENRRAQVRELIGQRKLEEEWTRFLREMRGEAYVDIRSGAGAAQQPAEAAPAAPAASTPAPQPGS
jgi:peptidyl-prolyl cis-trans isomerase SurA